MPTFSSQSHEVINVATEYARHRGYDAVHEGHLIIALLNDRSVLEKLDHHGLDAFVIRNKILGIISRGEGKRRYTLSDQIPRSANFNAIVNSSVHFASNLDANEIGPQELLLSAAYVANDAMIEAINYRNSSREYLIDAIVSRIHERKPSTEQTKQSAESTSVAAPHQTPAPIRVEQRDGRLVPASERGEAIDAIELDFDRWRAPVAESLAELLDTDLCSGTNHERLRRRLLALEKALAGTIDDVKENQFRLGYSIESLGDLVGVYRNAADDMPTLNAAVLADVNRLHIQLMLGLSKLAAWSRFQQVADADDLLEGTADPATVGAALAEAEAVLAGLAAEPIVDPELPRSFRWIREAIADPITTTKRMVYGAVKSLENVGSFLGQLALRTAKEAAEAVAGQISKRAAAALLVALSGALLHLSGALPAAWPWLKPLLEAAARVVGTS